MIGARVSLRPRARVHSRTSIHTHMCPNGRRSEAAAPSWGRRSAHRGGCRCQTGWPFRGRRPGRWGDRSVSARGTGTAGGSRTSNAPWARFAPSLNMCLFVFWHIQPARTTSKNCKKVTYPDRKLNSCGLKRENIFLSGCCYASQYTQSLSAFVSPFVSLAIETLKKKELETKKKRVSSTNVPKRKKIAGTFRYVWIKQDSAATQAR